MAYSNVAGRFFINICSGTDPIQNVIPIAIGNKNLCRLLLLREPIYHFHQFLFQVLALNDEIEEAMIEQEL